MPDNQSFKNKKTPLRVGITGGIGSGKTTVCQVFESLGVPVYYADTWAKWLIENEPVLVAGVTDLLGSAAYCEGVYQRAWVAEQVFGDAAKLAALNALVHPAVEAHSRAWHAERATHAVAYTLKEAALMIESGSHRHLDALVVVTAPEALRVERVMRRDGLTEAAVRSRMARQLPEADKVALADFLLENDGHRAIVPQVWGIHRALVERSGAANLR
jgi:dephospho-CoA kinase